MEKKQPLEVGEKYLSVSLLGGQIKLAAFKNQQKTKPEQPDYTGNGIAVWINKKKAGQEALKVVVEDII